MKTGNFRINTPYYLTCDDAVESAYNNSWPQQRQQQQNRAPQRQNQNRVRNQFGRNYMYQGQGLNRNDVINALASLNNTLNEMNNGNDMQEQVFDSLLGGGSGSGLFNSHGNELMQQGQRNMSAGFNNSWKHNFRFNNNNNNNANNMRGNWGNGGGYDYPANNINLSNNNNNTNGNNLPFYRRDQIPDRAFNGDMNRKRRQLSNSRPNVDAKMPKNSNTGERPKKPKSAGGPLNLNKHPVMLLNEIYTKQTKTLPIYNLAKEEGPVHRKTFLYTVTLGEKAYTPNVESKTKKEAKAMAARFALEEMGILAKQDGTGTETEVKGQQQQ